MAIQQINVGTNPNDGTGDSLRTSFTICNNNFSYLNSVVSGNGIVSANSLTISGNVLLGQALSFNAPSANLQYAGTANTYVQMVMQNKSPLSNASTDYVVTADNGNDSAYYGDFGIASSGYLYQGFESILPNDTYLLSNGGNLLLNAGSAGKSIKFVVGGSGTAAVVGQISNTAVTFTQNAISTSTTTGALTTAGGAGIVGNLNVGGNASVGGGLLVANVFTGTYSDGIIVDYFTGNGRISVGSNDGLIIYNGGQTGTQLVGISKVGDVSTIGNITLVGNITSSTGAGNFVNVTTTANSYIGSTTAAGFNLLQVRSATYAGVNQLGTNVTSISTNISLGHQSRLAYDANANVTLSYNSIFAGTEKVIYIRNVKASGTANVILPNSNNNKGTNVIPISAGTVASISLYATDTTSANVMAIIINS